MLGLNSSLDIAAALDAPHHGTPQPVPGQIRVDSRAVQAGDLFVALPGARTDGHQFVAAAQAAGAAAALVREPQAGVELPQIVCADAEAALVRLAGILRAAYTGVVLSITGSNGKTTVKNLLHSILAQSGPTLATLGNQNNEIGVPITLSRLTAEHRFAVVEMGAGKPGDIAFLCAMARPSVGVVLNAMAAHLERLGSVQGVAETKGAIVENLGAQGAAIINADSPYASQWRARAGAARVIDFALQAPAAVGVRDLRVEGLAGSRFTLVTPLGEAAVHLPLVGEHNVANALAAAAAAIATGVGLPSIVQGLAAVRPESGRLTAQRLSTGVELIDDSYNANPASVRAAIDVLAACPGRRTLILGAMGELGADSASLHLSVGEYARDAGIDQFWGVGAALQAAVAAFGAGGYGFADRAAVIARIGEFGSGDSVLLKGSRSAGMEEIAQAMRKAGDERAEAC